MCMAFSFPEAALRVGSAHLVHNSHPPHCNQQSRAHLRTYSRDDGDGSFVLDGMRVAVEARIANMGVHDRVASQIDDAPRPRTRSDASPTRRSDTHLA